MRRSQLLRGSSREGSLKISTNRKKKKNNWFLIKLIEMNPIQISQPYRKSGQSKEVHTELPNSGVAFKLSCSLTEFIFLCAFHTLQIFPLSSVPTKLFSEMEIVLMQMLSRNWTDSILCILSELIQGPVPSFPGQSRSWSHTKMCTERGKTTRRD